MRHQYTDLKRIEISSEPELKARLDKNSGQAGSVMLVTHTNAFSSKHVSHEQIREALGEHDWVSKMRYTLNKSLIGHVIAKG